MKSFLIFFAVICCLCAATQSAAVEQPVVAELQKDNSKNSTSVSQLGKSLDCIQPKETGRCFALIYRFAYDVEKDECVEFVYGGCSGNSNNFETKEDCQRKCLGATSEDSDNAKTTVAPNSATEAATEKITSS